MGAPISHSVLEYYRNIGSPLYNVYGLSETSGPISMETPCQNSFGSVGMLLDNINIKIKEKEVLKIQKRIKKHRDSILLFMNYKSVPFHNNSSEQAIRMTKVKQKISGGHRSQHGAQRHSVLLSIIETAKKIWIFSYLSKIYSMVRWFFKGRKTFTLFQQFYI